MKLDIQHIKRKWMKLRLQPIRVFCFHQVSDVFVPLAMWECDWMSTEDFKTKICDLQNEYTFISLPEAYQKLQHDTFRMKKYAVLTADDGSKTIECILPWLHEQHIPLTMFLNGSYLDGKTYREDPAERYFTIEEIMHLNMDNITFGHHSWNHKDLSALTKEDFASFIQLNKDMLSGLPNVIPFWAYPYGTHSAQSDEMLLKEGLIPLYMDGEANYMEKYGIHRELL
jgi:peptidoglycan/xylan/chitin deacetylase (PgdA/CDA1 family)